MDLPKFLPGWNCNSHHFIHFTNTNHQIDLYEIDLWKKSLKISFVDGCSHQQKHWLKGFLLIFFQLIQIFLIWWQAEVSCILVPLERYTSISKDIYIKSSLNLALIILHLLHEALRKKKTQSYLSHEKNPRYFPLYWLVNRDPYNGLL